MTLSEEADIAWDMFVLRYWDYLAMPVPSEAHFLERGCLAIIVAGAAAHGGNCCHAFGSSIEDCPGSRCSGAFCRRGHGPPPRFSHDARPCLSRQRRAHYDRARVPLGGCVGPRFDCASLLPFEGLQRQ